ncbi:MAG: cell division protein ZapB [Treponema sp.]|nr:cell division protein ZapB [Treponema sp.]
MITLDQVLLLEQKVEGAVQKIAQLQQENDALRTKCSELTNALSSKSEQLSSFEQDQNKIETGILKALDRLNAIENSILKAAPEIKPLEKPLPKPTAEKPLPKAEPITPPKEESVSPQEQFDIF